MQRCNKKWWPIPAGMAKLKWVWSIIPLLPSWRFIALMRLGSKVAVSHYSNRQIFVQKFNFDKKKTNIFTSFSPKFLLTIFLVKSKLSTAKKSKTTTFSRVFHPKNRQFSREIKVEFLDKK